MMRINNKNSGGHPSIRFHDRKASKTAAGKPLGIYIHLPFCVQKCRYCDFLSFTEFGEEERRRYLGKVMEEIVGRSQRYRKDYRVDSIFIGGGTPSLFPPSWIEEILDTIYARFHVAEDGENTMEVNPGTVTENRLKGYRRAGINRLSVGVQSFRAGLLTYLGRIHTARDAEETFCAARAAGFSNINLDLIFGIPGQTMDHWKQDMHRALALGSEHLSFYSFQDEEGTAIHEDIAAGRVQPLTDLEDRLMYHHAVETLNAAGYTHYEISNAARPGFSSRHNLKYWSMEDFLGIGLGAHSYMERRRFANTEVWKEYMIASGSRNMTIWTHRNTEQEDISEYVFLGLRKTEGINLHAFQAMFGKDFWDIYSEETEGLIRRGLLEHRDEILRLTPLGLDLSNQVFMEYV